jgi:hypothetical protein
METGGPCSTTEWNGYINDAIRDLWDVELQSGGEWCLTFGDLTCTAGISAVALPTDFVQIESLVYVANGTQGQPYKLVRRDPAMASAWNAQLRGKPTEYYVYGGNGCLLWPTPDSAYALRVLYRKKCPVLSGDSDTFDFVTGWHRYVTQKAASRAVKKEGVMDHAQLLEAAAADSLRVLSGPMRRRDVGAGYRMRMEYGGGDERFLGAFWYEMGVVP